MSWNIDQRGGLNRDCKHDLISDMDDKIELRKGKQEIQSARTGIEKDEWRRLT